MWQLSFPYPEEAARTLVKDATALKAEIVRRCEAWHAPVPDLLRGTPLDGMSGYPVYDRELLEPHILRTPTGAGTAVGSQRRVTLLGDAAHPMTPFKAQGANQALGDAVLLADCLAEGVQQHGPHVGFDAALPLFEHKMLSRSARVVVGSREKARELHSFLALQPARKVQREADGGVDMQQVIRVLRAEGIGAHSAFDARGLDAVVAAAMESSSDGETQGLTSPPPVAHRAADPLESPRSRTAHHAPSGSSKPGGRHALLLEDILALKAERPSMTAKQLHEQLGSKHGASLAVVKRCASAAHKQSASAARVDPPPTLPAAVGRDGGKRKSGHESIAGRGSSTESKARRLASEPADCVVFGVRRCMAA